METRSNKLETWAFWIQLHPSHRVGLCQPVFILLREGVVRTRRLSLLVPYLCHQCDFYMAHGRRPFGSVKNRGEISLPGCSVFSSSAFLYYIAYLISCLLMPFFPLSFGGYEFGRYLGHTSRTSAYHGPRNICRKETK